MFRSCTHSIWTSLVLIYMYIRNVAFIQVARLPKLRQLSRELLLDILDALADERSEARTCQDMTNDC